MTDSYIGLESMELLCITDKAGLFRYIGSGPEEKNCWIPWKLIEDNPDTPSKLNQVATIYVSEWFANKEGLI